MTCKFCSKEFDVEVTTMNNVPGGKEKEEIICPYCHEENGYRMTSDFVKTKKKGIIGIDMAKIEVTKDFQTFVDGGLVEWIRYSDLLGNGVH